MVRRKTVKKPRPRGNLLSTEQRASIKDLVGRLVERYHGQKQLVAELERRYGFPYAQSGISRIMAKGEGGSVPLLILLCDLDGVDVGDLLGLDIASSKLARDMPLYQFQLQYTDKRYDRLRSWIAIDGHDVTVGEMIRALEPLEDVDLIDGEPDGGWSTFFENLRKDLLEARRVRGRIPAVRRAQKRETDSTKE